MRSSPSEIPPDFADAIASVRSRLGRLGTSIRFFPTVGSTNDIAAQFAAGGPAEGSVVFADAQTAGRGRRGRTWFSPPGSGLYVSVVLLPGRASVAPDRAVTLTTLAAGVALAEGVEQISGLAADIKWPNDLIVHRRKLAGILAEGVNGDSVVLGYGINVNPSAFPPELRTQATSLASELGRPIDRATLFGETLAALARRYDDLLQGHFDAILDAWRARAPASRGTRITWETPAGPRSGITAGIDDRGALLVQVGAVTERIVSGEVQWS